LFLRRTSSFLLDLDERDISSIPGAARTGPLPGRSLLYTEELAALDSEAEPEEEETQWA
jgi:hypothetical protein